MAQTKVHVIDTHTAGEPTRFVLSGAPELPGSSIMEKKNYMMTHKEDEFRLGLVREPRGHKDMFGTIILPPCDPSADFGLIFLDGSIYDNMCGHATIAAGMLAVERGMVPVCEPVTMIRFETPAGVVTASVQVKDGHAVSVSFENVPCFVYQKDVTIMTEHYGLVTGDIVFGGNFFFIADADALGLSLSRENSSMLVEFSKEVARCGNEQHNICHPTLPISGLTIVQLYSRKVTHPGADQHDFVMAGDGQIDRSPCGTGTSAKLADMYARGELAIGQPFVYEGICDIAFTGRVVGTTKIGGYDAIIPEITGMAHIISESDLIFDDNDPLRLGFALK